MIAENLEKNINRFLQQKINFCINGKSIKSGKLILFCIKDFYLVFTLSIQHTKKVFEIPYPYHYLINDNKITLNYTLDTFCRKITEIENYAKLMLPKKPNKFYNTFAEITIVENS